MTRGILSLIAALCLLLTGCSRGGQAPFGIDPRSAFGASAGACNSKTLLPVLLESPDVDYARTMWNIGLDEPTCIDDWAMASTTSESPGFQRVRVLFHRVANTLNYLDIKTVVVSCGTCYDQLQGYKFEDIFPGCRIIDIHEYLLEKGITLPNAGAAGYLYHDPCHTPMKLQEPMKTVKALMGPNVLKSDRCCGESGTLGVTRPDISTQVRFRKEEELRKDEAALRAHMANAASGGAGTVKPDANVKILTSCPSCLQGLSRYQDDMQTGLLEADYIVVEMARKILGETWLEDYVGRANAGGIERVLV